MVVDGVQPWDPSCQWLSWRWCWHNCLHHHFIVLFFIHSIGEHTSSSPILVSTCCVKAPNDTCSHIGQHNFLICELVPPTGSYMSSSRLPSSTPASSIRSSSLDTEQQHDHIHDTKALRPRGGLSRWFTYNRFIPRVLSCIGVWSGIGLSWAPIMLPDFQNESVLRKGFKRGLYILS